MKKLFTKYSDDSEGSLCSAETDLKLPLLKNCQWPKGLFISRCKTLEQFTKRSKISTFPKNFQGTNIQGGVVLISTSCLLYFIVN